MMNPLASVQNYKQFFFKFVRFKQILNSDIQNSYKVSDFHGFFTVLNEG